MSYSSERVKEWRKNTKDRMIASMGGCCQICGYNKSNRALEFHHLDPSIKDLGFGGARASNTAWPKLVEELRKCIMVCSNCHKELHDGITTLPETFNRFNEDYAEYKK